MEYRQLGKSSLQVSRIGFGCMSLKNDEATNIDLIHQALDMGINYFDTADLYDKGANEVLVGKALKEKRKQVVIATKAGNQWRPDGSGWDWNPRKDYILGQAEKSLKALGTDYIDLYQLHGGTMDDPIDETIEAFEQLKQQGKILFYGTSSIRPNVIREWVKRSHIVSVMMQYSLLDRRPEEACLDLLKGHNISVVTRGSVAQGLLAGKPAMNYLDRSIEQVEQAAQAIRSLARNGKSQACIALQYVLHHPSVTSAVAGIRTKEQLMEAVQAVEEPPLTEEEYQILQNAVAPNFYREHR